MLTGTQCNMQHHVQQIFMDSFRFHKLIESKKKHHIISRIEQLFEIQDMFHCFMDPKIDDRWIIVNQRVLKQNVTTAESLLTTHVKCKPGEQILLANFGRDFRCCWFKMCGVYMNRTAVIRVREQNGNSWEMVFKYRHGDTLANVVNKYTAYDSLSYAQSIHPPF